MSKVDTQRIQRILRYGMKEMCGRRGTKGPGMALLVKYNEEVVFEGAVGLADIENEIMLDSSTVFDLASVSKHFTVVGILILASRSLLNVSDLVSDYIEEFCIPNVTIEHIIWHTSGLSDYTELMEDSELETVTLEEHMLWLSNQRYSKPGRKYKYNNSGYVLLALLIERVSGISFPKFYQENIFDPLGMTSTTCVEPQNKCPSYEYKRRKYRECHCPSIVHGDGNIFTTLKDLDKWDNALRGCKLISRESWDWMCTPGVAAKEYGGGLEIMDDNMVGHSGSWAGVQTNYYIQFNPPVSIFALSNCEHDYEDEIIDQILDLF